MWFTDYEIEQQQRLIAEVKKHYGLPEVSIEKDLWVTQVLHALFSLPVSDKLIFKGGTSLSKAWVENPATFDPLYVTPEYMDVVDFEGVTKKEMNENLKKSI